MPKRSGRRGFSDAAGEADLFGVSQAAGKALARQAPDQNVPDEGMSALAGEAPRTSAIGADGHRERMRARLLTAGPDALADHEMLEMLLFLALPRRDTKPIARALLDRFGGFGAVIAASPDSLRTVEGLGDAGIAALKLAQASASRLLRAELSARPVLKSWDMLVDYLRAALRHEKTEQVRILFLDGRSHLIADEVMGRGTVNHAPVYPREVARRALELHAVCVVMAHNHPSGAANPSHDDVAMTREIKRALHPLGIDLHDHLIIAGDACVSLRQLGVLS